MFFSPSAMHIPDGFLSTIISITFWVISVGSITIALRKVNQTISEKQVPMMGVLAAAVFAGQMLNFTVTGGTSGHLLGAALTTILVGPWSAILVMTAVVATQAVIFQDGGILALGANLFNMGVLGVAVSYSIFQIVQKLFRGSKTGILIGGFAAAWSSIFFSSLGVALQLALSGTFAANLALPAMGGIHALIGIGEGLITVGALSLITAARADLLSPNAPQSTGNRGVILTGAAFALLLAILSPLASSHPDGLEWVAEEYGFLQSAQANPYQIIPDYALPGVNNEMLATIGAGVLGVILILAVTWAISINRRKKATTPH